MGDFVEEKQSWIAKCSSTLDGLISCLVDDAVQFAFEVLGVLQDLLLLYFAFCVVEGNKPVGIDGVLEVVINELSNASS
jgi:hypothetical protein